MNEWDDGFRQIADKIKDVTPAARRIGDNVISRRIGFNYHTVQLRQKTGRLFAASTRRGAFGNIFTVIGNVLTWGVDYEMLPYAKWAIEGRGPVIAKRAKALRFVDWFGNLVFRKRVRAAPARLYFYLTPDDIERAKAEWANQMEGR